MDNITEAIEALTLKPLKTTSFQRVQILHDLRDKYADLLQPIRFGLVMQDFLARVDIPLKKGDLIAGRYVDREISEEEEQFFQAFLRDPKNLYRNTIFDTGHCTLDWEDLINVGLVGLKKRAEDSLKTHEEEDKRVFLQGAVLFYDALLAYIARYAKKAKEEGKVELYECLDAITKRAPSTFREGLQLCWIVAFIDCAYITGNPTLSLGRLDKFLIKLYENDLKTGILTKNQAKELIIDYYCKHNLIMGRGEHQLGDTTNTTGFARILNFDAPQYLTLAGTDEEGKPMVNALTYLFVECIVKGLKNPVVVFRYYKGLADDHPKLWKTVCAKALQSASLMVYNDNDVISALMKMGIPEKDAREYEHFGCNWTGLGKNCCWLLSAPFAHQFDPSISEEERKNLADRMVRSKFPGGPVDDFLAVLREIAQKGELTDIETLYDAYFDMFRDLLRIKLDRAQHERGYRNKYPSSILKYQDCFTNVPIKEGVSINATGANYYFHVHSFSSFATMIDCFTAVDQLVIKEKKLSLNELLAALDANFEGYDEIYALCRKAEKFGSDGDLSNYHADKFTKLFLRCMREENEPYLKSDKILVLPSLQCDTWNIKLGALTGATPDGRLAHEPYSQNSRPSTGACSAGLTGMFNSLLHMNMDGFVSGALNVDVQPKDFTGDKGLNLFASLLKTYFDKGGLHVQVSCTDVTELIDAKVHPDKHRDLMVRVTGYSGIFVDMAESVQDYVIERMEK